MIGHYSGTGLQGWQPTHVIVEDAGRRVRIRGLNNHFPPALFHQDDAARVIAAAAPLRPRHRLAGAGPMKLRRIPRTEREGAPDQPDDLRLTSYQTKWGTPRYLITAWHRGRALGDKDFGTHEDARAYGELAAKWHGARFVDRTRG